MAEQSQDHRPPPSQLEKLFVLARKIFYDEQPKVKHICHFLAEEGKAMRKGWALFLVILLAAIWVYSKYSDLKIQAIRGDFTNQLASATEQFSISNSFFLGKISAEEQQINSIQKQLDDLKRDSQSEINGLKTDNAKVTGERDNALLRNAQLESMPQTAFLDISNAHALISMNSENPSFQLDINGVPITNYLAGSVYLIPLKASRKISLFVEHLKENEMSVDNLTIDVFLNLNATNLIIDNRPGIWKPILAPDGFVAYEMVAQQTTTSIKGFNATSFSISTNIQSTLIPAVIDVFAPRTRGIKTMTVYFTF